MLLLDEPLAALDLKLRRAMQVELKTIQREVGITFLFVTHDQDEALSMSDRVAIMNDGVIEQCGTPEDVYENPTSVFAAGFIGTSNLMQRHVRRRRGARSRPSWRSRCPAHTGSADGDRRQRRDPAGEDLDERLHAGDGAGAGHDRRRPATTARPRSTSSRSAAGITLTVLEQNLPRMRADDRWSPGDRVQIGWLPEHAVVLR